MIHEKQERRALARKHSKEEFEKLIINDRLSSEGEKARELSKKSAKRELAQHYKECIGGKECTKVQKYVAKRDGSADPGYFPFVEGENIQKDRQAKGRMMQEEMRGFLQQQREEHPPRHDCLEEERRGPLVNYPLEPLPSARSSARSKGIASVLPRPPSAGDAGEEAFARSPHIARHPRFLTRASEHMSRRLQDQHVRKALEEKVLQTKAELEAANSKRDQQQQLWQEGMKVNDALRYDREQARLAEKLRNAELLKNQMQEQKQQRQTERQAYREEKPGYWGPEEKPAANPDLHREHCSDLIKQMEVDQLRRQRDRGQRLQQEKQIIDNCMAEMSQDRQKEILKQISHREVLTSTWEHQQVIKQTIAKLEQP